MKKKISEAGVRNMKNIRVGSRESRLAVVQSEMVMDYIKENCPEYTGTCDNENDRRQDPGSEFGSDRWKRVVCKGTGCGFDGWTQ